MVEFTISGFVDRLRQTIYDNFPYLKGRGYNPNGTPKHGIYNDEIREIAFMRLPVINEINQATFDIGSEYAEEHYPYYHILQQAQVIHKAYKGTKKSKGSQQYIADKGARDYEKVSWNGKTFTKEYGRNVRGARSRIANALKEGSDTYVNIHYKYIDRILDENLPFLAKEFGLSLKRKQDMGLGEDFASQYPDNDEEINNVIVDMLRNIAEDSEEEEE